MSEVEYWIERYKKGEIHIIFCEPLAEFHHNLAYCPYRDECDQLDKAVEEMACDPDAIHELVSGRFCWFCKSDDWLLVATSKGSIITMAVSEDFGKALLAGLKEVDFDDNGQ